MNIFLYEDYRAFLKAKIQNMARKGRGQIENIARGLGVHQSFVSQVLHRQRNFSEDQAFLVCKHLEFSEIETEYFIILVQIERAETQGLKIILRRQLQRLKNERPEENKLDRDILSLSEDDKQFFYSNWSYMAIWLLTAKLDTSEKISNQLRLPLDQVQEVLDFLLQAGLCTKKNSKISIKIKRTLVTRGSPMLSRHHTNWRLRSIDSLHKNSTGTLFYTHPMIISHRDAQMIREMLIKTISIIEPLVEPSISEKTHCLNIDWFEF